MSTIKSSSDHITINADGASKDIKFQANGVEKASISSAGAFTSTTIDATKLTGNLPAISGANLTSMPSGKFKKQTLASYVGDQYVDSLTAHAWGVSGLSGSHTLDGSGNAILITVNFHAHSYSNYAALRVEYSFDNSTWSTLSPSLNRGSFGNAHGQIFANDKADLVMFTSVQGIVSNVTDSTIYVRVLVASNSTGYIYVNRAMNSSVKDALAGPSTILFTEYEA